ncbi:MAG: hypothetical protein ACW98K_08350 [Candidatus Kariarchaeaceae archaeon]|jgi:hypothetical protein
MAVDIISAIFLLLTGVVALLMGIYLIQAYNIDKKLYHLWWAVALFVLFVSGVLIIILDFDVLDEKLIPVVAALIPVGIAIGLYFAVWEDKPYGWYFTLYAAIGIVLLTISRLDIAFEGASSGLIMAVHIPSGLSIVLLPYYSARSGITEKTSIFYSIGGVLISFGGSLLAFLQIDDEGFLGVFDKDTIYSVLPPLLLITGAFFVLGIILPSKWRINVPVLSNMLIKA